MENKISDTAVAFQQVKASLSLEIFGQEKLVDRILMALLTHGHLLVEGAPGLAKTTAIKALADRLEGDFKRIPFTPDLLPSDLTGTEFYRQQTGEFQFQKGPLFHNLILADEVNRSPAKVQPSLLEAMGEQQITIGSTTYELPKLFLVMATQNPIEQEGTYPLPEAQLDRFQMHVSIDYPKVETEKDILKLAQDRDRNGYKKPSKDTGYLTQEMVFEAQQQVLNIYVAENLEDYMIELILATRNPKKYSDEIGRAHV